MKFLTFMVLVVVPVFFHKHCSTAPSKDRKIDVNFALQFVKVYFCTGDDSWVTKLGTHDEDEHIMVKLMLKTFGSLFCSGNLDLDFWSNGDAATDVPVIVRQWFNELPVRLDASKCLETRFLESAKLLLCCKDADELSMILASVIREDVLLKHCRSGPLCDSLLVLLEPGMFGQILDLFEKVKICREDDCPVKSQSGLGLEKRQYDIDNFITNFEHIFCSDILELSYHFRFDKMNWGLADRILWMLTILWRRPLCCIMVL